MCIYARTKAKISAKRQQQIERQLTGSLRRCIDVAISFIARAQIELKLFQKWHFIFLFSLFYDLFCDVAIVFRWVAVRLQFGFDVCVCVACVICSVFTVNCHDNCHRQITQSIWNQPKHTQSTCVAKLIKRGEREKNRTPVSAPSAGANTSLCKMPFKQHGGIMGQFKRNSCCT